MGFHKHCMEGLSLYNSSLISRKNQAKFENDCLLRNGHNNQYYSTKVNDLGCHSFLQQMLYLIMRKKIAHKVLKIPRSAFWGHPVYIYSTKPRPHKTRH